MSRAVSRKLGAAGLVLAAALVSGCGSGAGSTGAAAEPVGECTNPNSEVRFGVHTEVRGFNVVNGGTVGGAGGTERAAVFDSIMQYDTTKNEFVPRMAESFTSNPDYTEWTLTLRPGIKFASGAPVTTDAVKFSVDRHGAPNTVSSYKGQMEQISSMDIQSPTKMVFTLKAPRGDFPAVFASAPGMLVDPAVFQAKGAEAFALDPGDGGAGPYKVTKYTRGEEIVMTRRDDYWGEKPCVGTIRFVTIANEDARRDAFRNGELDLAVFQSPTAIADLRKDGGDVENFSSVNWGDSNVVINNGTNGSKRPGTDLRVRQAIAYALNPKVIDDRATGGTGIPSSALVTDKSSLWSPGLVGPPYDPERAKSLLAAAKADGYNGKITLSCDNAPAKVEWAIAVKAMLEASGFEVALDNGRSITDLVTNVYYTGNYDLLCFPMSVDEAQPWATFSILLGQDAIVQSRVGYKSEAMGRALDKLRAAGTASDRQAAVKEMQTVWNAEVPMALTGHGERAIFWQGDVSGLKFMNTTIVQFDTMRITN